MTARNASACLGQSTPRLLPVELSAADSPLQDAREFTFEDTPRLTVALRRGDEAAFRFLHSQWNARLMRYCFALAAGDEALAREVAQTTYLRIFRNLRCLGDETALWDWIASAARCAAIDARRTRGRYQNALGRFADWFRCKLAGDQEENLMIARLDAALAELPEAERHLIEARYFRRISLEEIATEAGTTVRAVEGRLARVRQRLRTQLAQDQTDRDSN